MATVSRRGSGKSTGKSASQWKTVGTDSEGRQWVREEFGPGSAGARNDEMRPTTGDSPERGRENAVLRRALQQAGEELGLSKPDLAMAVGELPFFFASTQATAPIAPATYLRIGLVLRLHESLSSLVGDNDQHMRGWMGARNRYTGGIPAQQLSNPNQLERIVCYLEALYG